MLETWTRWEEVAKLLFLSSTPFPIHRVSGVQDRQEEVVCLVTFLYWKTRKDDDRKGEKETEEDDEEDDTEN